LEKLNLSKTDEETRERVPQKMKADNMGAILGGEKCWFTNSGGTARKNIHQE